MPRSASLRLASVYLINTISSTLFGDASVFSSADKEVDPLYDALSRADNFQVFSGTGSASLMV
jgi:hypothetical protein